MGSTPSGISGSRAAAILGMSDWSTPVEAWLKIMGERQPGFCATNNYETPIREDKAVFRWGLAFEDPVIELAEKAHEESIGEKEFEFCLNTTDREMREAITCHVDGIYYGNVLHEGKTTNARSFRQKWGEPGSDLVPQEYQIQVQHQMLCADIDKAIISVLVFPKMVDEWEKEGYAIVDERGSAVIYKDGKPFASPREWAIALESMGYFYQYTIEANESLQELMLNIYQEWWGKYVIGVKEPPVKKYSDILKIVKNPCGTIVASEQVSRFSAEYKHLLDESKKIAARKDELKVLMVDHMRSQAEHPIDDDSVEKFVLRDSQGRQLHTYNGKRFR
jgi:hypothetical protein